MLAAHSEFITCHVAKGVRAGETCLQVQHLT